MKVANRVCFKIKRVIYLQHKNILHETKYQIDLACVYIDTETRQGRVVLMENIHKE